MNFLKSYYENTFRNILADVDVEINGNRPWDIHINNSEMIVKTLTSGSLGLGDSYVNSWWDCDALDQFFQRILIVGGILKLGEYYQTSIHQLVFLIGKK